MSTPFPPADRARRLVAAAGVSAALGVGGLLGLGHAPPARAATVAITRSHTTSRLPDQRAAIPAVPSEVAHTTSHGS